MVSFILKNSSKQNNMLRKPDWLRVPVFGGHQFAHVSHILEELRLNTVCLEAKCPNRGECFNRGTATFLILGSICTRNCRFCNIKTGKPSAPDPTEPARVAEAVRQLKLKYVVVTSVTRDDLDDDGANHFADTVSEIRKAVPEAGVEILTPDFRGSTEAPQIIMKCRPDIFNHNVETVPRLYAEIRPAADYNRSLNLLRFIRDESGIITKSGIMLGLGETREELIAVFNNLAAAGISILTLGQYLAPSLNHVSVKRYVSPQEFSDLKQIALESGIPYVLSGPLVRSSYRAEEFLSKLHSA
ncbi:MAG: lipoyl synthase [candidate division Zixibacteria bacterium]|nr:lipoyl synthase [candidate division Zixibacteria bacterium]